MHVRFLSFLLLGSALGSHAAIPTLTVTRTGELFLPASDLTTNGIPGLSNAIPRFLASGVPGASEHGGRFTFVGTQAWARFYRGPSNYDQALGIAVDASGHVCVTGYSLGQGTDLDIVTLKYASDGQAVWTNRYDGPVHGRDAARLIAVDRSGNVFVAGSSDGVETASDVVTLKYSPQGVPLWTNRFNAWGTNNHDSGGLAVDAVGDAYVSVFTFGSGPGFILVKYAASGQALWTNYHNTVPWYTDTAGRVAVDHLGNVFLTGHTGFGVGTIKYASDGQGIWTNFLYSNVVSRGMVIDASGGVLVTGENGVGGGSLHIYAVVKYAGDGTPLWTNVLTGPLYHGGGSPQITLGSGGESFLLGGSPEAGMSLSDFTIVKFSANGLPLWTNRFSEPGGPQLARPAVNLAGDFFLPCHSTGLGGNSTSNDIVVVKYARDGTPRWTNRFNGPAQLADYPAAAAADGADGVFVAGYTKPQSGVWNYALVKYVEYIRYTPPPYFVGTDTFSFVATDASGNSATNTVSVQVTADALWFNPIRSDLRGTNGTLRLHLDGATGNAPVILHAAPDLGAWTPIATNMPLYGAVEFLLPAGGSRQFYRAVQAMR